MKTFQQFISEDFNSPKATQIDISSGKSRFRTMAFFESVPKRSFNLIRYLRSFDSENARDILSNLTNIWRGLIFNVGQELLVFVWESDILHDQVCNVLDKKGGKDKVPKFGYRKTYNVMTNITSDEMIGNDWCFPFIYSNGKIRTNLYDTAISVLDKQKNISDLFQLSEDEIENLTLSDLY